MATVLAPAPAPRIMTGPHICAELQVLARQLPRMPAETATQLDALDAAEDRQADLKAELSRRVADAIGVTGDQLCEVLS